MRTTSVSDAAMIYLIREMILGVSPERRVAAKYLLECIHRGVALDGCIEQAEKQAIIDLVSEARNLANQARSL